MSPVIAAKTADELLDRSQWWVIGLAIAILVFAWAAYRLRSWFGEDEGPTDSNEELLTHIRELHSGGAVSEEEFRSIKDRLTQRMEPPSAPSTEPGSH